MSDGRKNEGRCVIVHVEGDTNVIYVKAFASSEGVELLNAGSHKRVYEALSMS